MSQPSLAFRPDPVDVPLDRILPLGASRETASRSAKYKAVLASIRTLGLVEPIVVHPQKGADGYYFIADGHLRYYALKELEYTSSECLIATTDDCYTYNAKVNRLSAIQEHMMVKKAIQDGVSEATIAAVLNIQARKLRSTLGLLDGIDQGAVKILKDKVIAPKAIRAMRRVSADRQVEMAELMVAACNYTRAYAEALVVGTPSAQLRPIAPPRKNRASTDHFSRMAAEISRLEKEFKTVQDDYGQNMLRYAVLRSYMCATLTNERVKDYIALRHSAIFEQLAVICKSDELG